MSLLKSNPATLALGANAIAFKAANQAATKLTASESCYQNSQVLCDALRKVAKQIEAKTLRIIVSNHYARYLALPWQPGLVNRDDWLAVAQHAFRSQFGAMAELWEVRIHFNGYGKQVTACAMDQTLIDELYAFAAEQQWHIAAVEPLWMSLVQRIQLNAEHSWLLQVEPERALLCAWHQGEWQQFSVINPPSGQEQTQSLQLVMRQLQAIEHKPKQVHVCAAPSLRADWHADGVRLNMLAVGGRNGTNSAVWMAEL